MSANADIVRQAHVVRRVWRDATSDAADYVPGSLLTMRDGSVWFHPSNGRAPVCERPASPQKDA